MGGGGPAGVTTRPTGETAIPCEKSPGLGGAGRDPASRRSRAASTGGQPGATGIVAGADHSSRPRPGGCYFAL